MIRGLIIHGAGRGKGLGIPTLNLNVSELDLAYGVYAVWTHFQGQRLAGVMNWGARPSFDEEPPSMEVHLLDFEGDLYGEEIAVEVVGKIREVQRFNSKEELVSQIEKDIAAARKLL